MDLTELNLFQLINGIKNKIFSASELVDSFIKKSQDDKCNVFITTTFDQARSRAKELDNLHSSKMEDLKLPGIVYGVKDVFCTKDIRTTCGSNILNNFFPKYESTVTQRIIDSGGIMIGKMNMDEFSMGSSNKTSFFGPCINPLIDKTRSGEKLVPGGSSGGPAVGVLNKYCSFSIGGDTGGSIKQPASFCGIIGVRPTFGTCSRHGLISYSSSLDQPGIFSKNVLESAYLLDIISGYDINDSSMSKRKNTNIYNKIKDISDLNGFKIGIPDRNQFKDILPSIHVAWDKIIHFLESKGAQVINIKLPMIEHSLAVYYIISTAEASSNLSKFDGIRYGYKADNIKNLDELYLKNRTDGFGKEVKRRIMLGTFGLSSQSYEKYYLQACKIRRMIQNSFNDAFKNIDVLVMPTSPGVAFGINDKISVINMYMQDILTIPSNLAGLGGINVPVGLDNNTGLPIGMQFISNAFEDEKMFTVANIIDNEFEK